MRLHGKRKSIPGPVHDLADMQARVSKGNFHPYQGSAVEKVVEVYGCREKEVKPIIQKIFALLTDQHYAASIELSNGTLADEYGVMYDDLGWFVKFSFDAEVPEVDLISCHLTRYPLRTRQETIGAYDVEDES